MDDEQFLQDNTYPGDTSGALHPALIDFRRQMQDGDGAQWAKSAADKIQAYLTTRALAQQPQQAGEAFMQNAHATQQNLVSMVKGDPYATDLALDLAGDAASTLASHHPDGDEKDAAVSALSSQFRGQIAHAAVQTLAGMDAGAAHAALDRYGEHLGEDEQAGLNSYIEDDRRCGSAVARTEFGHRRLQAAFREATGNLNLAGGRWAKPHKDGAFGRISDPR
jgi:hypothetical protein